MLSYEIVDTIIGIFLTFVAIFDCGRYCDLGYKYVTKVFDFIFYLYLTNVILQFQTFMEISLAYDRTVAFTAKRQYSVIIRKLKIKLFLLLIFAFLITMPNYLISRSVRPFGILSRPNQTDEILYMVLESEFTEKNEYWTVSLSVFNIFRGLFFHLVLLILNCLFIIKYKQFLKSKNSIRTQIEITNTDSANNADDEIKRREIKLTKMIFALNCNFLIVNLPIAIASLLYLVVGFSTAIDLYVSAVNFIALLTHISPFFLYLKFNKIFRKTLLGIYQKYRQT